MANESNRLSSTIVAHGTRLIDITNAQSFARVRLDGTLDIDSSKLNPEDALVFAHWILDMFENREAE
jgi:hypothetical protein